jgi:hypothetical protein
VRAAPHRPPVAHAKPLGLIVNELAVNALKYAFPGGRSGTVRIAFECRDGECTLRVKDDGIGVDPAAPPHGTGLGRRMVRALARQIGGSFQIGPGADGGMERTVNWRSELERPAEHCPSTPTVRPSSEPGGRLGLPPAVSGGRAGVRRLRGPSPGGEVGQHRPEVVQPGQRPRRQRLGHAVGLGGKFVQGKEDGRVDGARAEARCLSLEWDRCPRLRFGSLPSASRASGWSSG